MIVDTHTHVASDDQARYPLQPAGAGSDWFRTDPVTVERLARVSADAGVDKVVLVQSYGAYTFDNRYVLDGAASDLDRFVSMAIVDMEDPASPALLREYAARPGFTGIRLTPVGDPSPTWLDDAGTFPVWETCAELGLRMLVVMQRSQLPRLRRVLAEFPDQAVVLDHCGFPDLRGGPPFAHASDLFAAAELPNLHVKVTSTLFVHALAAGSDPRDVVDRLVEAFGADRIVWGSDWPQTNDRPYSELLALGRHACERQSPDDTAKILGGNALRLWPELATRAPTSH